MFAAAVQWAVGAGIIQGTGSGNLDPGNGLTRAQAAAMLQRFD
ncbi:MAG: S-layer homology domain-containing protein, partial [Oscillospiraceae bacterium]|nr:S-layer homology domain-containing protein [Oscillospiraceae bacterium]